MNRKLLKLYNFVQKRCYQSKPNTEKYQLKNNLSKTSENLFESQKNNIYYSSVYEDNFIKLGYKQNKQLENVIKRHERTEKLANINVRPIPIALKYLQPETNEYFEPKDIPIEEEPEVINFEELIPIKIKETPDYSNWMQDYEHYQELDEELVSHYGTPDSSHPVSKIPCYGCGALLHCADPSLPGYLPSEIFKGRSSSQLKTVICQRCHFLKNYNTAINVTVPPNDYIEMISTIKDKFALVILMVDLFDFPCSIWPGITDILGTKRPVFVIGNKVDLLPKDSNGYLNNVKACLENSIIEAGVSKSNIQYVGLISAETGFGVEEMITKLHSVWGSKGDVYLVGCTNVGKSSLFNALLRSDFCKVKASSIIQKATACPWPGTTLRMLKFPILRPSDVRLYQRTQRIMSEKAQRYAELKLRKTQATTTGDLKYATLIGHIGRTFDRPEEETLDAFSVRQGSAGGPPVLTLNEKDDDYIKSKWCFDTPGVMHPEQCLELLTTEELLTVIPKEMIRPRTFLFKPEMSLFLAGLGRFDYLQGNDSIRITVYSAKNLPIIICDTRKADEIYKEFIGTEFLGVPCGDEERMKNWPGLSSSEVIEIEGKGKSMTACDIVLSSAGWIGVNLPHREVGLFKAWTPMKKGIFIRNQPLIPYGVNLRGPRVRNSLAYRTGQAFIKQ